MHKISGKISIIGAGFVGSTIAYALMMGGVASNIVIVDVNKDKAIGEAMDLNHGSSFVNPVRVIAGDYKDIGHSDIVIITAGANQKPGETRLDLVKKNTEIFKSIIPEIMKYSPESILLVVSNPVDILTYVTYKLSGLPANKVIGSGTALDTARFKYLLSEHIGVDARNIHAYILGEHGDSEVPAWSLTNVAGMAVEDYCKLSKSCSDLTKEQIFHNVKNAAYEIINKKGATYYAIGLAVERIVEVILRDEHSVLTVSSVLNGQYGLSDIALSLPTVVTNRGIGRIIEVDLDENEINLLKNSGNVLSDTIKQLNL